MAVLPAIPGLSVQVEGAGEFSPEYEVPEPQVLAAGPPTPECSCYIESKSGAKFAVVMTVSSEYLFPPRRDMLSTHIVVDGAHEVKTAAHHMKRGPNDPPHRQRVTGVISGSKDRAKAIMHRFRFTAVKSIDDSGKMRIEQDKKLAAALGTIKVGVIASKYGDSGPPISNCLSSNQASLELSEKAMKGSAPSSDTDSEAVCLRKSSNQGTRYKAVKGSLSAPSDSTIDLMTDALRREMIIPRSPSPEPRDTAVADLSEGELRRLAGERLEQIKRGEHVDSRSVKREMDMPPFITGPLKIVRTGDGTEVFDLTDD
ncbi:Fc.00g024000.m01.CDS01 [Cosmosporella sp. VM-42]